MERLAVHLALHGTLVLTISSIGGLVLYRRLLDERKGDAWHLLHAGGSARGVMLIALAAVIHIPVLPAWLLSTSAWLIIVFVWASTLAMLIGAVSGEKGFGWPGSNINKAVYVLYVLGVMAIFPGILLLIYGLLNAL